VKTPARSVTATLAEAEFVELATLVAVTVCVPAVAGGVYNPLALIVPTVVLPPETLSTLHVTPEPPVTHAVNCWVCVLTTTAASDGVMLTGATVNAAPALGTPPTVTTTLPVVAPVGTETAIEVAFQAEAVAVVPLNITVLMP